jgi:Mrp family chromosome partitioning ATPase
MRSPLVTRLSEWLRDFNLFPTLSRTNFIRGVDSRPLVVTREDVLKALEKVADPELGKDIVTLHMVDDVVVDGGRVTFTLNLTTPACPLRSRIEAGARDAVSSLAGVKEVKMKTSATVFATRDYEAETLKGVKNVIAIASGKGGVGKSTVTVNIASALAASGAAVGILDADIYGPNIPHMMGLSQDVEVRENTIIPPVAYGVKVASLGFFYKDETPLIWRGPMVAGAVRQLITQVDWGELDYLIVDLPPGCLPAGSMVLTASNLPKPIEQVKVGEFVLSYDGEKLVPRRVLGVIPQGKQMVYRLKTPNRTILASANHPFLKYHRKRYWRRLDQLKVGDRITVVGCILGGKPMPLPVVEFNSNFVSFPSVTDVDFMRIVGHFVGDGFVRRQGHRITGTRVCEPRDSKFREEYEWLYRRVFRCKTFDDSSGRKFAVASVPLAKLFVALDLDHRASEKFIPDWVFSLPNDQRLAFIRGYAEADAHIRHRSSTKFLPDWKGRYRAVKIVSNTVSVESTNETLVRQLHELCLMSGLRADNVRTTVTENQALPEGRSVTSSTSYSFEFSMKLDESPFKIARITSIERVGEVETYDLQVDEFHNFVANSIIVHNTGDAPLTLAQTVPLGGVVIVTTPQEAALNIAAKSLAMFRKLNVPILGVVENMSYFLCPHCGERVDVFSTGGGKKMARDLEAQFLGEIPLDVTIREQSDLGSPVVFAKPDTPQANAFKDIAFRLAGMVSIVAFSKSRA